MIPRYTRPEMGAIWTLENKFRAWLKIEIFACEAWARKGIIPEGALEVIKAKADFDLARIEEIEAETRHDVIAFLTSVSEKVGPESRFIHLGLTSSDVVDTGLAALMVEAGEMILADIEKLLEVLKRRAYEHKDTICVGRSHGIHAEPTSFGLKFALWHAEMTRNKTRMQRAKETISVGKLSGAVGQFGNIDPEIEEYVCKEMGLTPAPISTQVIQRDRHAEYMSTLAIIAASIEKIAVELRHLQRTEVLEAEEKFYEGQKGSSAMPHKRNPITAENLTGLARVVKGHVSGALDNVALWHERDISHSSIERVIIPDSTILIDTMLHKLTRLLDGLTVYPENMMANLKKTNGLVFSQKVLLDLVQAGLTREEAYSATQSAAMRCWKEKKPFVDLLMEEKKISDTLTRDQVEQSFDITYYLRHIDVIYKRVFEMDTKG